MNMRNATCVRTQTSKVPTLVALLFISYSMLIANKLCRAIIQDDTKKARFSNSNNRVNSKNLLYSISNVFCLSKLQLCVWKAFRSVWHLFSSVWDLFSNVYNRLHELTR